MKIPAILFRKSYNFMKNVNRVIFQKYSSECVVQLNETTLIGRIVLFLNDYNKPLGKEVIKTTRPEIINLIANIKPSDVKTLKYGDIEELLCAVKDGNYTPSKLHFQKLLNTIDSECCSRLSAMDSGTVLKLLSRFMQVVPNRITEYKSYAAALDHIVIYVEYLTKEELLQFIFYIGLQKKTKQAQHMLKICMRHFQIEDIKRFSIEEVCIVCHATFKTSTKISNKVFLEKVRSTLHENLHLLKDPAMFITLIKTIRHNRYQDEDLLNTITCTILFNRTFKCYSFTALCHILAMYADYSYYDDQLMKLFVDLCLKELDISSVKSYRTYVTDQIRVKDITRFLWVLSNLGYKDLDRSVIKTIIVPKILDRIGAGLYKNDAEELVNSVLYLWMLNYQAVELLPHVLTVDGVQHIREIKSKTKDRLNLLLTCMYFENRKLFKKFRIKAQPMQSFDGEHQLRQRSTLKRVYDTLRTIAPNIEVNKFELNCQIPHLNVYGITGYKRKIYKSVHVEVLDDYVCLKNRRCSLTGLMQLKLRILNDLDEAVLKINEDEIINMNEDELKEYLKTEIEFVC